MVFGFASSNAAPDAVDDAIATDEDTSLSGSVLADNGSGPDTDADGDTLTVTQVNGIAAAVGTQITLDSGALLTLSADGSFDYNPNGQFEALNAGDTGTDSFAYSLSDDRLTDTATVTMSIAGGADAPYESAHGRWSAAIPSSSSRALIVILGKAGDNFLDGRGGEEFLFGGDDNNLPHQRQG